LVGWLVDWLVGWLIGWLIGSLFFSCLVRGGVASCFRTLITWLDANAIAWMFDWFGGCFFPLVISLMVW
jgi:hypothetical protein